MNPYAYDVRSRAGVGLNGIEISVGVHIYQTISALTLRMTAGAWWRFFFHVHKVQIESSFVSGPICSTSENVNGSVLLATKFSVVPLLVNSSHFSDCKVFDAMRLLDLKMLDCR
jgi:hypothetical protein